MRKIDSIVIHCSATPEGRAVTVAEIRQWHRARGWRDIGYHYVIYPDGSIHAGRPVTEQGAHCTGHNATSIGICYVGGCAADGKTPKDTRTEAQRRSMYDLCRRLMAEYNIKADHIYGHNQFAQKACPSFNVGDWIRQW